MEVAIPTPIHHHSAHHVELALPVLSDNARKRLRDIGLSGAANVSYMVPSKKNVNFSRRVAEKKLL